MAANWRNDKGEKPSGVVMLRNIGRHFSAAEGISHSRHSLSHPAGEIDLVARKADVVAFVEVKARPSGISAIDAVGFHSQQRIRAAADLWLARHGDAGRLSLRFDIVAILPRGLPQHFIDAF